MRRRTLLQGMGSLTLSPWLPAIASPASESAQTTQVLGCARRENTFVSVALSPSMDTPPQRCVLPERGHGVTRRPGHAEHISIGRRPATFAVVSRPLKPDLSLASADHRHFYGHACYSTDGRWLYTTENDYERGSGVIGVRDAERDYVQVDEWDSGGIGPHDLALLNDGKTLVIAHGGFRTHPDAPRESLNPDEMKPSLSYFDTQLGKPIEHHTLADHYLSIRHLGVSANDTVCFGCQYEGPYAEPQRLVGTHRQGEPLRLMSADTTLWQSLHHYIGSVAVHPTRPIAATSSPRGNRVAFWHLHDNTLLGVMDMDDVCGLAVMPDTGSYVLSSGKGVLRFVDPVTLATVGEQHFTDLQWDNHLAS